MKQRLLAMCFMLTAVTVGAVATDYGFYVGGVQVTSNNASDLTKNNGKIQAYSTNVNNGKPYAKFDKSSNTLTLWNVKISTTGSGDSNRSIYNKSYSGGLIIVLKGINSFSATGVSPLRFEKSTTIKGEKYNSSMKTYVFGGTEDAVTVRNSSTKLTISGATLEITSNSSCFEADGDYPTLAISNATITATCKVNKSNDCYALKEYGSLSVSKSTVTLTGYSQAVKNLKGFSASSDMDILTPTVGTVYGTYNSNSYTFVDANNKTVDQVVLQLGLPVTSTNFPDANFLSYLKSQSYGIDGYLTGPELQAVTSIDVNGKSIKDLTGIKYFTALTTLKCDGNSLTALDVSNNKKLTSLLCYGNNIKDAKMNALVNSLPKASGGLLKIYKVNDGNVITPAQVTIAKNKGWTVQYYNNVNWYNYTGASGVEINSTNFPDANFRTIVSANTIDTYKDGYLTTNELQAVTEMDVNGKSISNLKGVENFTALKKLYCHNNNLSSLDVSKNTALKTLYCYGNNIGVSNMENLVESLPACKNSNQGTFVVVGENLSPDNTITKGQVTTAKNKYWKVQKYDGSSYVNYGGVVEINSTNFPDKSFRNYLLSQDYGKDSKLTDAEIMAVKDLNLNNYGIKYLTGIEYFTALEELYCAYNSLTSLDVSKNTALTELFCIYNNLKSLDVSKNTALTQLYCYGNSIESLDVSKNTALTVLHCSANSLKSLDVSKNTALTKLNCYYNSLESLDVSNNTALTDLECSHNSLESLDVSKNTALTDLDCSQNSLASLDVSKNTALTDLDCSQNSLESLDVSKNTALKTLNCYRNQIKGPNMDNLVSKLPDTQGTLIVFREDGKDGNVITDAQVKVALDKGWTVQKYTKDENDKWVTVNFDIPIDATNFPDDKFRAIVAGTDIDKDGNKYLSDDEIQAVTELHIKNKEIADLKGIEFFTALMTLECQNNNLTSLDLSKNTNLNYIVCLNNNLNSLDVSPCKNLMQLICRDNGMTSLNASNCTALEKLDCSNNSLTSLNVLNCTALKEMSCYDNRLASLNVSNLPSLEKLYCSNLPNLTSLDVSNCTALKILDCCENSLITLIVSNCTALSELYCDTNSLTSLDLSSCTALSRLHCYDNSLTSLDLSSCTAINELYCMGNMIEGDNMWNLVKSLPKVIWGELNVCCDDYSPDNVITAAQVAVATNNGWTVYKGEWDDYREYAGHGDVNGDNKINQADLDLLVQIVMGQRPEGVGEYAGDVNKDGKTDAADVVILVNILNGK